MDSARTWGLLLACLLGLLAVAPLHAQTACPPTVLTSPMITLAWDEIVPPAGTTKAGYLVGRQRDSEPWDDGHSRSSDGRYTETGLVSGSTYRYRVIATVKDAAQKIWLSTYASHGTPPPCVTVQVTRPPVPPRVQVLPSCGPKCMTVTWENPDPMRRVEIYWRQLPQAKAKLLTTVPGTSLAHSPLPGAKTHCYAVKEEGTQTLSPETCSSTAVASPAAATRR